MLRPLDGPSPRLRAPAGTIDTHIHFFTSAYEWQPGGPPPSKDATVEDYAIVQKRLGLDRAVIVQPGAYQRDNRCLLAALAQMGECARGIVAIDPEVEDAELERLTALGVRGVRIMHLPGGAMGLGSLLELNARVAPFGWHPITQFDGRELPELESLLSRVRGDYVIDHTAKFLEPVSPDDPAFHVLLRLVDRGNCYVKISACYETSKTGAPNYDDVGKLASRLIAHAPERMLWASNWPHVSAPPGRYPDDAELLDVLLNWAPEEEVQRQILLENPARLYGFDDSISSQSRSTAMLRSACHQDSGSRSADN